MILAARLLAGEGFGSGSRISPEAPAAGKGADSSRHTPAASRADSRLRRVSSAGCPWPAPAVPLTSGSLLMYSLQSHRASFQNGVLINVIFSIMLDFPRCCSTPGDWCPKPLACCHPISFTWLCPSCSDLLAAS